jgi:hypothetical protein
VFWIEAEAFAWDDALVYMVMTDRFATATRATTPARRRADPRGDWMGGDLDGPARPRSTRGTLDELGVRAIWLTPFQTNPEAAYLASDGQHKVTGYHGYWPTRAREVDPRLGGAAALTAIVREAHKHGIRILQDYVVNHVHEEHEYVAAAPRVVPHRLRVRDRRLRLDRARARLHVRGLPARHQPQRPRGERGSSSPTPSTGSTSSTSTACASTPSSTSRRSRPATSPPRCARPSSPRAPSTS